MHAWTPISLQWGRDPDGRGQVLRYILSFFLPRLRVLLQWGRDPDGRGQITLRDDPDCSAGHSTFNGAATLTVADSQNVAGSDSDSPK